MSDFQEQKEKEAAQEGVRRYAMPWCSICETYHEVDKHVLPKLGNLNKSVAIPQIQKHLEIDFNEVKLNGVKREGFLQGIEFVVTIMGKTHGPIHPLQIELQSLISHLKG